MTTDLLCIVSVRLWTVTDPPSQKPPKLRLISYVLLTAPPPPPHTLRNQDFFGRFEVIHCTPPPQPILPPLAQIQASSFGRELIFHFCTFKSKINRMQCNTMLIHFSAHRRRGMVMVLQLSVVLFTGGGGGSLCGVTFCLTAWSHVPSRGSFAFSHVPSGGL